MTHLLGIPKVNGQPLKKTYFVAEDHANLPRNQQILALVDGLLTTGETQALATAPPRRVLRVLVVADPAEDMPLPGAEKEGREVASIFRAFNEAYNSDDYRVEVVTLFGPAEARTDKLAPSFAEAFFARGVANFVCTAWPVDDVAAREFAGKLYCGLLGLKRDEESEKYVPDAEGPLHMHAAMREARKFIAPTPNGTRTWGAYQHYGNPYLRFFDHDKLKQAASTKAATPKPASAARHQASRPKKR